MPKLQGGIQTFAEKYGLSTRRTNRLQLACEELIYEMLNNACADTVKISLDVTYSEAADEISIKFSCAGNNYNPLAKNFSNELDEENLGATILQNLAKNFAHDYSGDVNLITFALA